MNFGRIIIADCVNTESQIPLDPRCADPAFAMAHPEICPVEPTLFLKPGFAVACVMGKTVQFRAFIFRGGLEEDVTDDVVFTCSDTSKVLVGASTGGATAIAPGEVTITATHSSGAQAHAKLLAVQSTKTDCCDDVSVAFMVVVDRTRSMSLNYGVGYATRLAFAKHAASNFISAIDASKDYAGLIAFDAEGYDVLAELTQDIESVASAVSSIGQTQQKTAFKDAFEAAISRLNESEAIIKVLVVITDGEDSATNYTIETSPLIAVDNFKTGGGAVVCLGVRASGRGYRFLSQIATGGMFVNAYPSITEAALAYFNGIRGYLCGGNCVEEGDIYVGRGKLNYNNFKNWEVVDGCVDLQGNGFIDYLPGHGLYVDLHSGDQPAGQAVNGKLVSKVAYPINEGETYRITVELAGNQVQDFPNFGATIRVYALHGGAEREYFSKLIIINDYKQPFTTYSFNFNATANDEVYISIQQTHAPQNTGGVEPVYNVKLGLLLNLVKFENMSTLQQLLYDDFNTENNAYVIPRCGQGTTWIPTLNNGEGGYYTGYDCARTGCLDQPPPAQMPDPETLPDIESGYTPPKTYTETQSATVQCPSGWMMMSEGLIPAMTSNTSPSGEASASSERVSSPFTTPAHFAFDASSSSDWYSAGDQSLPQWIQYVFEEATEAKFYKIRARFADTRPKSWTLTASNDGVQWVTLHSMTNVIFLTQPRYYAIPEPGAYRYYRWTFTEGEASVVSIESLQLYGDPVNSVTRTATATSEVSAEDARNKAYAAALAEAEAALACAVPVYRVTEHFTAKCPLGSAGPDAMGTGTATSYNSEDEARELALVLAEADAYSKLDCSQSNNTQPIYIENPTQWTSFGMANPYPSVKYVSDSGIVGQVIVTLNEIIHDWPADIGIALMSPSGTIVELMRGVGGGISIGPGKLYPAATIMLRDDAADYIPHYAALQSGVYKPTRTIVHIPTAWPIIGAAQYHGGYPWPDTLETFAGEQMQGPWALFVIDSQVLFNGKIANGWELTIIPA